MLVIMSSVICDQKHGSVLLILMGKIRIDNKEFTPTNETRYHLRTVLGSRVHAHPGVLEIQVVVLDVTISGAKWDSLIRFLFIRVLR